MVTYTTPQTVDDDDDDDDDDNELRRATYGRPNDPTAIRRARRDVLRA